MLVVEDDIAIRAPLVKFLELRDFTVVTAATADEGLEAMRNYRLTAAVVDLRLRHGAGREIVASAPPDVPVIILGVPVDVAAIDAARPHTKIIEKPYSLVLLVETLEQMLLEPNS